MDPNQGRRTHPRPDDPGTISSTSVRPAQRATRRRGAELLEAIHRATADELAEHGFDAVTFDRVARRARMSKATIYRRYRSPAHLIAETLAADATRAAYVPTGSLREDLIQIMALAIQTIDTFGVATYRRLIGYRDDSIEALLRDCGVLAAYDLVVQAVEDAQRRGEIGSRTIPEAALRVPIEVLHSRILITNERTSLIDDIVDVVTLPLFTALGGRLPDLSE